MPVHGSTLGPGQVHVTSLEPGDLQRGKASGGRTPPWLILACSVPWHLSTPCRTFNVSLLAHRSFCLVLKALDKSLRSGASLLGFECQLLHLTLVGHEASLLTSPGVPSSKMSVTSAPMLDLINGPYLHSAGVVLRIHTPNVTCWRAECISLSLDFELGFWPHLDSRMLVSVRQAREALKQAHEAACASCLSAIILRSTSL